MVSPFLKWAGGKRWLATHSDFVLPNFGGRYVEPFLGGAAMFFSIRPSRALLSDLNHRLIETYAAVRDDWRTVVRLLGKHHNNHSKEYYYRQRASTSDSRAARAAQFIYLNRACWNGLYRVNKAGAFNVPIGTKDWALSENDDFAAVADRLVGARLSACDFGAALEHATSGDFAFVDPPYTVAHNANGFVKYNEKMFSWDDQKRLADCVKAAVRRGARVYVTNADHESVRELYSSIGQVKSVERASVISGTSGGRRVTTELLIDCGGS